MLGRGYLAVDLFFVLSGFVMALNYGTLFRDEIRPAVFLQFLARRLTRLYPIYGTILLFRLAYTALRYGRFDLQRPWIAAPMAHPAVEIPANLLLVQAWGICPSSIGPAWSVSTEWGAYFVFPALAMLALWRGRSTAGLVCAGAAGLIAATALLDAHTPYHEGALDAWDGRTMVPLMRCLGGFTLGMLTWRVSTDAVVARIAGNSLACWACLVWLLAGIAWGAPDAAIYPVFPSLVLCLACGENAVAAPFTVRPVIWLGEISYSLYVLHIFLLHPLDVTRAAARAWMPPVAADTLAAGALFALLLAASDLCFRYVEQPGRRLTQRAISAIRLAPPPPQ
jgi:peptidoglycan/LPS O-acetylase OafA/YrhL